MKSKDTEANSGTNLGTERLRPNKGRPHPKTQDEVILTPSEKKQKLSAHSDKKLKALANAKKDHEDAGLMASTPIGRNRKRND